MLYGKYFAHVNVTASVACCACGGGKEVLIQSNTSTPPQSTRTPTRGKDIFLDIQDFQENDFNEEIMFIEEEGSANVTPSIVGGTEVDPPRKYKVGRCMCLVLMLHVLWWLHALIPGLHHCL